MKNANTRQLGSVRRVCWATAVLALTELALASCHQSDMATPRTEQDFWVEEIATGINAPRSLAWLPDGEVLLAQWEGKISVLRDGKRVADLTGTPAVLQSRFNGLRDIELDPDFNQNHLIYLSYTAGKVTQENASISGEVFRARLDGTRLLDGKVIFSSKPQGSSVLMGPLLFLPDKTLLVTVGSLSQDAIGMVQRLDNDMGKIIRINRDGSIPKNNPFVNDPTALPEIYAIGLRNPSGLARMENGTLWVTDIGPKGGDELNELKAGANYGWPLSTWGFDYTGEAMAKFTGSAVQSGGPGLTDPVLVWEQSPSQTPSSLAQYKGKVYPFWDGDLFTGGLSGQTIRRLRIQDGIVTLQETMLSRLKERFRTVAVGPDNHIYILTDDYGNGRILRLVPGSPPAGAHVAAALGRVGSGWDKAPEAYKQIANADHNYDAEKSAGEFDKYCSGCHSFAKFREGKVGPDLDRIDGRKSGSLSNYRYSSALSDPSHKVLWNYLTLSGFLENPQGFFPGSAMNIPPVPLAARDRIVDYLTDGELAAAYGGKPKATSKPKSRAD